LSFPKKQFGQHFLTDKKIADRIADILTLGASDFDYVLEIGPGRGIMTQGLLEKYQDKFYVNEIDGDLIPILETQFPELKDRIIHKDFLDLEFKDHFKDNPFLLIGNFPYNISTQIVFKCVDARAQIPEFGGMFQKEVAQRIAEPPGSKVYGILSAWSQAFYDINYKFTVNEGSFFPPPKIKSGVIHFKRKEHFVLGVDEKLMLNVMKAAFGQRRKTLRNSLSLYKNHFDAIPEKYLANRPEQLGWMDFAEITSKIKP
jgi:16S rRNA (adenine1518-N6/adenine1519-N6)-dimethyltransferase